MAEPTEIQIDDLAAPVLSETMRELNALSAAEARKKVPLDEGTLFALARDQTGLNDFGSDDFREGLGVLLRSLETEADLTFMGRVSAQRQVVRLLANRLLVEDAIRLNPEALDAPIVSPIVILGLPRTGTSHLHNLLSNHPDLRSLPYWESCEPVPAPGDRHHTGRLNPRVARTEAAIAQMETLIPHQQAMHELTAETPHEEIAFFQMDFASTLFSTLFRTPSYRAWYEKADLRKSYAYVRRCLQLLSYLRGRGKRWVLKSTMHLARMGPLMETYPDARVVMTLRDPARVTLSLATMAAYSRRLVQRNIDPAEIGRDTSTMLKGHLDAAMRDLPILKPEQLHKIHFHEYMRDPMHAVAKILTFAGVDAGPHTMNLMRSYQDDHPRGKFGQVIYRYKDVGLDPTALRDQWAPYMDAFGVRRESD
jgi:hypothetical protein